MSAALSLYIAGTSGVHRLHPLTKLALAGLMLSGGLTLPGPWLIFAFLVMVVIPLSIWGEILIELIVSTVRIVLPYAISVFLIQGFLWTGGTLLFNIGPFDLKKEGLLFALTSTGRILMVVTSFLWFAFTTRPDVLMSTLTQRGFPPGLSYVIVATLQIIPRFQVRAATILDAQQSRGLNTGGGVLNRARALLPLVVPLVLSSLIDVEERALAIEARGFNHPGEKTSLIEVQEASWEPVARWFIAIVAITVVGLGLWLR